VSASESNRPPSAPPVHPPPAAGDAERAAREEVCAAGEISTWQRYSRRVGFAVLIAVSAYGVHEFANGDAAAVGSYWSERFTILPLVLLFATIDVAVETTAWIWVYRRFGMHVRDLTGVGVALSGKAGLLLPAQLGRLIRPDEMVRLGRGQLPDCLKAEAAVFVLDSISVLALFAALIALLVHPILCPLAGLATIGVCLYLGGFIVKLISGTKLELPEGFWWKRETFAIVVVQTTGWIAHGIAFYLLAVGLPGQVTAWDSLFLAPGSAVLGLASGLPGGIGATEALLGISLGQQGVPEVHLAIGVAAFRIVTFWIWIPIGWLALALVGRQSRKQRRTARDEE